MATYFLLFPRLPAEIRLRIWQHALPLFPRILEAKSITHEEPSSSSSEYLSTLFDSPNWIITPTSRQTLLHVNTEFRLEMGPLIDFNKEETICPQQPSIKLSCVTETLFINSNVLSSRRGFIRGIFEEIFEDTSAVKKELRTLAGNETFWEVVWISEGGIEFIKEFMKLEEIIIVAKENPFVEYGERFVRFEEGVIVSEERRREVEFWAEWVRMRLAIEGVKVRVTVCNGVWSKG
ncbi:hypothetical protein BGZ57DRAFT_952508 [Hyaloscypha finlandica]|nr:hypothetical protein BGZ57DRAFT_952508 [Hyaloscypha finlandica]